MVWQAICESCGLEKNPRSLNVILFEGTPDVGGGRFPRLIAQIAPFVQLGT